MIRNQIQLSLSVVALLVAIAGTAQATIITFAKKADGTVPGNNQDITAAYGSNATAANIIGATDGGEGFTPNIGLVWGPTGGVENVPGNGTGPNADILEFHTAVTFVSAPPAGGPVNPGPGFTVPILQFDVDASNHPVLPGDPTLNFVPDAGWAVKIHELRIGNANDQGAGELPYSWTISVLTLPGLTPTGNSYTTALLSAGSAETATFNFTGLPGVSYQLLFHDNSNPTAVPAINPNPRTAIDNVRFSQCVPEPSTLALVALCGLGLLATGRRGSL